MSFAEIMEIVTLATGLLYLFLEIVQSPWMWAVGIATGIPAAISFGMQHVWASMTLNIYYVAMSVFGIISWIKASKNVEEGDYALRRLKRGTVIWSAGATFVGTALLVLLLRLAGGQESVLDALVLMLSAIGTWWLARLYLQQWFIWVVADTISTVLCLKLGMTWLSVLYASYAVWSLYGWYLWKKKGKYID